MRSVKFYPQFFALSSLLRLVSRKIFWEFYRFKHSIYLIELKKVNGRLPAEDRKVYRTTCAAKYQQQV